METLISKPVGILPWEVAVLGFEGFPQHTQEKALSPASFHGVDLGGTSATRGKGNFGREELKTLHVSAGVHGFFIFLSPPFK